MGQSLVREAATESRVLEASANAPKPDLISKLLPKRTKKADKKDERGETALHRAVWLGQSELVTQLAKKQIDASVENDDGLTAFHLALLYGKVDLARILLDESASKVSCDATFGRNPFNLDYSISERRGKFSWTITNFSKIEERRVYSEPFTICGLKWKLVVYPRGAKGDDNLSLYLDVADTDTLPDNWFVLANFTFAVVNQLPGSKNVVRDVISHRFSKGHTDLGFPQIVKKSVLQNRKAGCLFKDKLHVEFAMHIVETAAYPMEDMTGTFAWRMQNISSVKDRVTSSVFRLGGVGWVMALYPRGKGAGSSSLSVYLKIADTSMLSEGWFYLVNFRYSVINQFTGAKFSRHVEHKAFRSKVEDWGFPLFMKLSKLHNPELGFLVDDCIAVEVQIEIIQSHRHISSNNKKSSARWQIDRPVKNMRITPLHWAAYNGHVEGIQELVKRGADVGLKDRRGRCALDWACTNGHLEAAQVLLDSGADPNIRDREGYSPLHKAVMGGYLEAAKLLLDWGANVDAQPPSWKERRKSHNTSSQYVASSDSLGATTTSPAPEHEAGDLSLAATEPSDNNTPASTNSTDVPHDANSIVEREDSDSTAGLSDDVALTPLHIALRATDSLMFPMINTLVSKYGADVNISDMLSRSPLHYAANAGNLPLLELFLQQGAYVDSQDEDGWTALHRATLRGHTQCVKLLVDYGADPAIKTNFGQTCLHMAVQNSNLSCVEAILAPQLLSGSHESVGGSAYLGGDGSTRLSPRQVIGDEVQHRESFDTGNVITSITEPEPAPIQTPTSPNNARRASVKIGVPQRPPDTQNVDLSNRHSRIKPKSIDPALLALLLPPGARVTSPPGSPRSNSAQLGQPNITQPSSKRRPLLKRSKSSLDVKHASQLRRSEGVLFHEDPEIIERRANSVRQLNESPPLRDRESRSMSPPSNRVRPRSNSTASSDKGSEVFTGRRHYLRTKGGDDKHSSVTTSSLLSTSPGDNIGSLSISPPHTSFVQPSGNGRQSPVPSFLTTSSRQPEQPEIASPASSPANTNAPPNTLVIPSSTPIAIVAPASESLPANEEGRRKSIRGASRGLRVTTDNAVVSSSSTLYSPPLSPPSMQRHSTADLDATLQWQVEPTPPQRQLAASSSPSCSPRTIRRTRSSSVADMRNRVNSFRGSKSNKRLSAHAESTAAVSPSSQKSISSGVDILTSEPVPFISSSTKKRRARSRSSHASSSPLGKTIKRVASALVPPTGRKHINIIELLNEPDSTGAGPLHTAVRCANLPLVKMLVQHGAQVNTKASNNTTPLDCAIQRSDIYTTIFLLENGAFISEAALQLLQFVSSRGVSQVRLEECLPLSSSMASDMRSLVNNQKYSDVVFKVDAMFFSNLRESIQPEIPITDVNYASFLAIIEYIYTDTIQFDVLTVDNALQLVGAANRYILEGLKRLIERWLLGKIDDENVYTLFHASNLYGAHYLRTSCVQYVASNADRILDINDVINTPSFGMSLVEYLRSSINTSSSRRASAESV